jgi:UDP-N-acetylmuramyl pentapeptide phosphotransferase/UDP-N-acetylglucosamine-1-phosphate transferase
VSPSPLLFVFIFLTSILLQLLTIYVSHKYTFFMDDHTGDEPQKFHEKETSRAGGIGILIGSVVGFTSLTFPLFNWIFILILFLAFLSGAFEDFHRSLSAKVRLFLQTITALTAVLLMNAVVTYLGLGMTMPYSLGILFSIFAIVGMMNAINIIDGFNGLASGIVLVILLALATVAIDIHNGMVMQASLITIVAILGFFVLNFPKGYIFLGDGGAYLLGFMTALLGIFLASQYENVSPWFILAIFIYPVWEVVFSIIRKKSMGRSPMEPDSYHLHMLIFRQITKNNPLTSVVIVVLVTPFTLVPTLYAHNSMANIKTILLFIVLYTLLYRYLYKKDTSLK